MIWPWAETTTLRDATDETEFEPDRDLTAAYKAILTTVPDPLLIVNGRGEVMMMNDRAFDCLETDAVGQHLTASIRAPALLDAFDEAVRTGRHVTCTFERHVPVERVFEAFITPVAHLDSSGNGKPILGRSSDTLFVLLRDFSAHQQIERMRADFVANASHELRTPLTTVLGFIETLQGAAKEDTAARKRFLSLMRSQAERMRRLIDDLLSLSRVEMNVHHRPKEPVDLDRLVRYICETLTDLAKQNNVELRVGETVKAIVAGDRDELGQVIQNLIENAIKYGHSGKYIDIDCQFASDRNAAIVSVRDHGPGIAAEHLPRLTERFYRVNVQASRERGGTGLGLAIVKHIINRHRGALEIESELGEGSVFKVNLPLRRK